MKIRVVIIVLALLVIVFPQESHAKKDLKFVNAILLDAQYVKEPTGRTYTTYRRSRSYERSDRSYERVRERDSYRYYYLFHIKSKGKVYTTRHSSLFMTGRLVSNWVIGDKVKIGFHKNNKHIYIQKPNGKSVKTRILRVEKFQE